MFACDVELQLVAITIGVGEHNIHKTGQLKSKMMSAILTEMTEKNF